MTGIYVAVTVALATASVHNASPLSLERAILIAEQNAFANRTAASNVEIARQRLTQTKGRLGPYIIGTGAFSRLLSDPAVSNQGQSFDLPRNNTTVGASLSLPIDISGTLSHLESSAAWIVRAQQASAQGIRNDVAYSASSAYFSVLQAEALVQVAASALATAREREQQGQMMFEEQQIPKVDLERLRVLVAQAESDLISVRNSLALRQNEFNQVLGRPIETPVALENINGLPETPNNTEQLVSMAQSARPEAIALRHVLSALAEARKAEEGGLKPSLAASLNYQKVLEGASMTGYGDESVFLGLQLTVPIFDSGITRARVKEARQNETKAKINLEQLELGISQEVRGALTNLATARARLGAAETQAALAEDVYRLAAIRQQSGVGTYVEIVDAQTQLTQARNAVVTARYDFLTFTAALKRAVGGGSTENASRAMLSTDRRVQQ